MLGLRFLFFPILTPAHPAGPGGGKRRVWMIAAGGAAVGLVCGVFGTGGGMMMLMALTFVLGYELKTAVGTSVFIMTFSALLGAVSHFALGSAPRLLPLALCVVFTLFWAQLAARIAAKADPPSSQPSHRRHPHGSGAALAGVESTVKQVDTE